MRDDEVNKEIVEEELDRVISEDIVTMFNAEINDLKQQLIGKDHEIKELNEKLAVETYKAEELVKKDLEDELQDVNDILRIKTLSE